MYYGIEQSTDLRDKRTVIKKFTSQAALRKWMANSGGYTYGDPDAARNHHRTFRSGFELKGRINNADEIFSRRGTPTYPLFDSDKLAIYIMEYGEEI